MTDVNAARVRSYFTKSIREGLKGITFNNEASWERVRKGIHGQVSAFAQQITRERFKEIDIHVNGNEAGMVTVTVSGPRDLIGGTFPGRIPNTRRLTVVGSEIADSKCVRLKAKQQLLGAFKDTEVDAEVIVRIENHDLKDPVDGIVFKIVEGGVTGWESFYVDDYNLRRCCEQGWVACAGTRGCWDRLFIPAEQMRIAFDQWGLIPKEPT